MNLIGKNDFKDRGLALIIFVGAALRVLTLARKSLWLDEVVTLQVAAMDVKEIVIRCATQWEPHPPLYYLLMHYWIRLGRGEFVLRLPSAVMGIIAVLITYGLVRQWGKRWSALCSAWLLAIAPLHIWYSQEARMYALVCTLGLASTLFYSLGIRLGNPLYWGAWLMTSLLGLYTDYSMLLVLIVQIAFLGPLWKICECQKAQAWAPLLAWLLVIVLFLPQTNAFLHQVKQVARGGGGYFVSLQLLLSQLGFRAFLIEWPTILSLVTLIGLALLFGSPWLILPRWKQIGRKIDLPLFAIALYLLILLASAIHRGLVLKRQGLILFPYVLIGIAVALSTSPRRLYMLAGLTLLTLPLTAYTVCVQEQESWRDTALLLEQQATPQDVILVNASYMLLPLEYYYRGECFGMVLGRRACPIGYQN